MIVGIGWDVGGWMGKKQGVAVATVDQAGVDWRGTARAFSLTEFRTSHWTLLDLIRLAWADAPEDTVNCQSVIVAIDAPLAFPASFAKLLTSGDAPAIQANRPEIDNPLAYRDCDRHIFETFRKKPFSASFDKLGNNATVAMIHTRRLAPTPRRKRCALP